MPFPYLTEKNIVEIKRGASLRQVEIICLVADVGSISLAAEILGMSAANVCRTCGRFEKHFGFPVFKKKRRGIQLTEEGKAIIEVFADLNRCIEATARRLAGDS